MPAQIQNFTIEQGATFRATLFARTSSGAARDLTGFTARMQIRDTVDAVSAGANLTDGNGGIVITALAGRLDLLITATATAGLTFTRAVYDLEIESAGEVDRLFSGFVTLSREVTR